MSGRPKHTTSLYLHQNLCVVQYVPSAWVEKKKNQVILNEPSPDTMSITIDMYIIITFSIVNNLTLSMLSIHNTVSLSCHEQVCLTTDTEQTSENIFMSIHTCLSLKIIPQSSGLHLLGLLP